jgi:hypothetical protein
MDADTLNRELRNAGAALDGSAPVHVPWQPVESS